jgi:hypothetical protein
VKYRCGVNGLLICEKENPIKKGVYLALNLINVKRHMKFYGILELVLLENMLVPHYWKQNSLKKSSKN